MWIIRYSIKIEDLKPLKYGFWKNIWSETCLEGHTCTVKVWRMY